MFLRDKLEEMHDQFLHVENLGENDEESDEAKSDKEKDN